MTNEIFELVIRGAVSASVAVIVVLLLRTTLRNAFGARVAYAFWVLVPVAMLANFLPAQQITITETERAPVIADISLVPETAVIHRAPLDRNVSLGDVRTLNTERVVAGAPADTVLVSPVVTERKPTNIWEKFSLSDAIPLLVAFWIAGTLLSLCVLAFKQRRFLNEHGLKNIKRRFHVAAREDIGPVVIGILKPFIVVPKSFEKKFNKVERNLILAHEREHIRSGDLRINAFAAIVQCLNWFNPVVHFAMRAFRVDQELACDERVMKRHGQHRRMYGAALLKSQVGMQSAPLGCMWGSAGASPLKQRLALLAKPKMTPARRGMGAAVCLASAMAVGTAAWATLPAEYTFITATQEGVDQQENTEQSAAERAEAEAQLDADFDEKIKALEEAALTPEMRKEIAERAEKAALAALPDAVEIETMVEAALTPEMRKEIAEQAEKAALAALPDAVEIETMVEAALTPEMRKEIAEQAEKAALAALPDQAEIEAQVEAALTPEMREEIARQSKKAALAAKKVKAEAERAKAEAKRELSIEKREALKREKRVQISARRERLIAQRAVLREVRHEKIEFTAADAKGVALIDAIERGRTERANLLIDDGANINFVSDHDGTPLMVAVSEGDREMVKLLIEKGADVNLASHGDGTALIVAMDENEKEIAHMLIEAGADVNAGVHGDGSPLIVAVERGNRDMLTLILEAGADPNVAVHGDGSPLIVAVERRERDIVELLLEAGADPNLGVHGDGSPLIIAAARGDNQLVELLLEAGADPNMTVHGDGSPLISAVSKGDSDMVKLLIKKGANVNTPADGDGNPLIAAALRGSVPMAKLLVKRGADVNGYVQGDETPLINAAQQGHLKVAEYLIDQGADVNLMVERGEHYRSETGNKMRSPLGQAERRGHDDMVKLLKKHGARDVPKED
ncbi:ankyrin repeat domain-containing protein [Kordiimonas aquimaris]|uniref:ankyrin repeat domain-containing protein n=1 Tax=Kordiimonas aquimaris TaxID=707591 RepID=UPI0021D2615B|nr:ankyrin repeat domain-containing protein [Kordiimonas aquimaris]